MASNRAVIRSGAERWVMVGFDGRLGHEGPIIAAPAHQPLNRVREPDQMTQAPQTLTATVPDEAAGRRFDAVLADVHARDARDTQRSVAPLKPADDALVLDSTDLGIEAVVQRVIDAARSVPSLAKIIQ